MQLIIYLDEHGLRKIEGIVDASKAAALSCFFYHLRLEIEQLGKLAEAAGRALENAEKESNRTHEPHQQSNV
jgi:hypothetical protein